MVISGQENRTLTTQSPRDIQDFEIPISESGSKLQLHVSKNDLLMRHLSSLGNLVGLFLW